MYSKVNSMTLLGIDGYPITIEVDVSSGLPEFALVGYLSSEVKEARERVRVSLRNSGFSLGTKRITVNLSPADIRKAGTGFDLAIAVGILASFGFVDPRAFEQAVFLGELSLEGRVLPVNGILPMVIAAAKQGFQICYVPEANLKEGAFASGIRLVGVSDLPGLVFLLNHPEALALEPVQKPEPTLKGRASEVDFSQVNGQANLRRAAEVAAAGMHNLLMVGPPGSGKTMIARRIPTILPELSHEECLEVTRIYSVCGMLSGDSPVMGIRPFRSPHHTITPTALVGGGKDPRPGEVSLAHRGVLFLDELPEFSRTSLEALRQPLEDRMVSISRVQGMYRFPSDFMLCAAMNPCRCGFYPDRKRCRCGEEEVRRYLNGISRPLLDRIDICVEAPPVGYEEMQGEWNNESSAEIQSRVTAAWQIQQHRFRDKAIYCNAQMSGSEVNRFCCPEPEAQALLEQVFRQFQLSARGYHRVLKVARTIADLEGSDKIQTTHVAEAISYRSLDQRYWR